MKKYPRVVAFWRFSGLSFTSLVPTWGITSALNQSFGDNRTRSTLIFSHFTVKISEFHELFTFSARIIISRCFVVKNIPTNSFGFIIRTELRQYLHLFSLFLFHVDDSAATTSCVHFRLLWPSDFKTHNNLIYIQIYFPPCFDNFSSLFTIDKFLLIFIILRFFFSLNH